MHRAGWGWIGGGGAWERERARLGTQRDAEGGMRSLVWSERQRGSGGLEVVCLGLCPERGRGGELGFTQVADRWGWGGLLGPGTRLVSGGEGREGS
jgi:hypothetical protein